MNMSIASSLGFLRSQVMYNWKPFNVFKLRRFYGQFVRKGDLCFDIGAHNGNRTSTWLSLGAKVLAIEPQAQFFKYLKGKFGRRKGFTVLPVGVSDEMGETEMLISSRYPTVSTFSADWSEVIKSVSPQVKWDQRQKVELVTMDSLISEYGVPDFCKIDVEGFEENVLKGLSQPLPFLSFEFLPETKDRTINCLNLLDELGHYEFNWSQAEELRFRSEKWLNGTEIRAIVKNDNRRKSGDIYARLINK